MRIAGIVLAVVGAAGAAVAWAQEAGRIFPLRPVFALEESLTCRGQAALSEGKAVVVLPARFVEHAVAEGMTIHLTCKDGWSPLSATPVVDGTFTVSTPREGRPAQAFWWTVTGVCRLNNDGQAR